MPKTTAVFFDLDGTLLDTAPDIYNAATIALNTLAIAQPSFDNARQYIGDGMNRFIKRMLTQQWWGEPTDQLFQQAKQLIMQQYAQKSQQGSAIYDGVYETLRHCQQQSIKLACITNKPIQFTLPLLEACQLRHYFHYIHCGDSSNYKKPNPEPLNYAAAVLNVNIKQCVMVGDSLADSKAAQTAGTRCFIVSYGYHRDKQAFPPSHLLIDYLPKLLPQL